MIVLNEWEQDVKEFHEAFGLPVSYGLPPEIRNGELRAELIEEEAKETVEAIRRGDLTEAIDGICDSIYVNIGAAIVFGVPLTNFFAAVHFSNMKKAGGGRREDGKVIKPAGWRPPPIHAMLEGLRAKRLRRDGGSSL